jgi:hypothetical protein
MSRLTAIERVIGNLWAVQDKALAWAKESRERIPVSASMMMRDRLAGKADEAESLADAIYNQADFAFRDYQRERLDVERRLSADRLSKKQRDRELDAWDADMARQVDHLLDGAGAQR